MNLTVFNKFLTELAKKDGSDLYFSAGIPLSGKIEGTIYPLTKENLKPAMIKELAEQIMNDEQKWDFDQKSEMNLSYSLKDVGRFRVNIFKQRGSHAMVIRHIKSKIPNLETLGLPAAMTDIIKQKRGLVLFVGATGSGKSTSLASLIDYRNSNMNGHIITVEDPIEFVHDHKKSIVNQREVGVDTDTYEDALKNILRQDPDVILIGEVRDAETMQHALAFAETGHLCITTLHANSSDQAIERILSFFPPQKQNQVLMDLSLNIRAIVSQRMLHKKDKRRTIAVELLRDSPLVKDIIRERRINELKHAMEKDKTMITFDQSLYRLYGKGIISMDEALIHADSANNLRLKIKSLETTSVKERDEAASKLTLEKD